MIHSVSIRNPKNAKELEKKVLDAASDDLTSSSAVAFAVVVLRLGVTSLLPGKRAVAAARFSTIARALSRMTMVILPTTAGG